MKFQIVIYVVIGLLVFFCVGLGKGIYDQKQPVEDVRVVNCGKLLPSIERVGKNLASERVRVDATLAAFEADMAKLNTQKITACDGHDVSLCNIATNAYDTDKSERDALQEELSSALTDTQNVLDNVLSVCLNLRPPTRVQADPAAYPAWDLD